MSERSEIADQSANLEAFQLTVVGVFEDSIDADHALADLRKDSVQSETVSVMVRDGDADFSGDIHESTDIATALGSTGLDHAGDWLSHLVSLVVSDLGPLLAAGPMGAVLAASDSGANETGTGLNTARTDETSIGAIPMTLLRFGYGSEEAGYLASRVHAGSVLIAVTIPDTDGAGEVRRIFADRNAVHIGTNWTARDVVERAHRLVRTPVETVKPEDVVVLDSVGVLVGLCSRDEPTPQARYRNRRIVDPEGNEAGTVDELLGEVMSGNAREAESVQIRYVVVAFGGRLGIRRERTAVPVEYFDLDDDPVRISLDREVLRRAPSYRMDGPFSRHEEEIICLYFGCSAYWTQP